jgi:hypothetical protein
VHIDASQNAEALDFECGGNFVNALLEAKLEVEVEGHLHGSALGAIR